MKTKKKWKRFCQCQLCHKRTWTIKMWNPVGKCYEYICDGCLNGHY